MKGYPKYFYHVLIAILMLLYATGCLLSAVTLEFRLEMNPPWHLASTYKVFITFTHALTAFLILWLVGAVWAIHMRSNWNVHKKRLSGGILVGVAFVLSVTALGIYYLGDETLANSVAVVHLLVGLISLIAMVVHILTKHKPKHRPRKRRVPVA